MGFVKRTDPVSKPNMINDRFTGQDSFFAIRQMNAAIRRIRICPVFSGAIVIVIIDYYEILVFSEGFLSKTQD